MAYWFTIFNHWLPQIFAKNALFGHFGDFQARNRPNSSNLLQSTWQHAFLSTSFAFYDISAQACAEIKKVTYIFRLKFNFLHFWGAFPFSPFLSLLLQWLMFYWACFQFKKFWESIIETGNFYHGVVMCSHRKVCSEFFTSLGRSLWSGYQWRDLFLLQMLRKDDDHFDQRCWFQKWNKGQGSSWAITGSTGVNGLDIIICNASLHYSTHPWKTPFNRVMY